MRVLHYSDHSASNLRDLFNQCDVFITTGDRSIFDFEDIRDIISTKPSFGVYGNHDTPGYLDNLGIQNMHLRVFQWNGFTIGGYQGCPRYKDGGGPQFTEEEATRDLENFPRVDILLLHAAPFGLLDTRGDPVHTGSKVVRSYVDRIKPRYIFCGHDEPSMELEYGTTKIYRTDKAKLILID